MTQDSATGGPFPQCEILQTPNRTHNKCEERITKIGDYWSDDMPVCDWMSTRG